MVISLGSSSDFIRNRMQQYNSVCMTNITNSSNVILLVATREAMGLSGWQPLEKITRGARKQDFLG